MVTISDFFYIWIQDKKNWHFSQFGFKIQTVKHMIKHNDLYF